MPFFSASLGNPLASSAIEKDAGCVTRMVELSPITTVGSVGAGESAAQRVVAKATVINSSKCLVICLMARNRVLVNLPALHDKHDTADRSDVFSWIAIEGDDVCLHTGEIDPISVSRLSDSAARELAATMASKAS